MYLTKSHLRCKSSLTRIGKRKIIVQHWDNTDITLLTLEPLTVRASHKVAFHTSNLDASQFLAAEVVLVATWWLFVFNPPVDTGKLTFCDIDTHRKSTHS